MLRDPALAPTAPQSLHIDATAIASEPAGTLRERHEAAPLGHEPGRRGKV